MRTGMRVMGGLVLVVAFAASAGAQSLGVKGGWAHPTLAGKDAEGAKENAGMSSVEMTNRR